MMSDQIKSAHLVTKQKLNKDGDLRFAIIESKNLIKLGKNISRDLDLLNSNKDYRCNEGMSSIRLFLQMFSVLMILFSIIMFIQMNYLIFATSALINYALVPLVFGVFSFAIQYKL